MNTTPSCSKNFLNLPARTPKPRKTGLTFLIDQGLPTSFFRDVVTSHGDLMDYVKFGWGTSIVTKDLQEKIQILKEAGVSYFFGGTLFEKALHQKKLDAYIDFCRSMNCAVLEISDGTIEMSAEEKAGHIARFAREFTVFSEVGYKDAERSHFLTPKKWIEFIQNDLKAGSAKVITEARESGASGICRPNGELRHGLIEEIAESGLSMDQLIFEAPNKGLQTYFIKRFGTNVNLGNISFHDVVGLETLRLGLRSDTLTAF